MNRPAGSRLPAGLLESRLSLQCEKCGTEPASCVCRDWMARVCLKWQTQMPHFSQRVDFYKRSAISGEDRHAAKR